jgi:hypothetical protein
MLKKEGGDQKIVGLKDNSSFYLGVLRFILGYILTSCYHLFNFYEYYDDISITPSFLYLFKQSLISSIPLGFFVGIIFVYFKKILNIKIIK